MYDSLRANSSMGSLLKWKTKDKNGTDIFVKTSTYNVTNIIPSWMYEGYSEVIVSKLLKVLNINNIVQYNLCRINIDNGLSTIGCYSKSFLKEDETYISIAGLHKAGIIPNYANCEQQGYEALLNSIHKITGIDYRNHLEQIIQADFITLNADRHLGNIGLIYNNTTGKFKIAPIFDNGNSLFSLKYIEEMDYTTDLDKYIISRPFHHSHYEQLKYTKTNHIQIDEETLKDVYRYIDELEQYGINKQRIKFIKQLITTRIQLLNKLVR